MDSKEAAAKIFGEMEKGKPGNSLRAEFTKGILVSAAAAVARAYNALDEAALRSKRPEVRALADATLDELVKCSLKTVEEQRAGAEHADTN